MDTWRPKLSPVALSHQPPGQADYDVVTSMLDAAIQSLSDADLRRVATADAFRTSSVAVQAQHIAWQDRA